MKSSSPESQEKIVGIESGIDWVTWVSPVGDEQSPAHALGARLVEFQAAQGAKVRPLRVEGYQGYQADECAYGFRKDTEYLRLSGSLAASCWSEIRSALGHPTRLDVQTTFLLRESDRQFGSDIFRERKGKKYRLRGRPPKRAVSQDNRGLWLGTVGTRTGRSYMRVYDKGVESGSHPAGYRWRVELEAKKCLAAGLWKEIGTAEDPTAWCYDCCRRAVRSVGSRWPEQLDADCALLPPTRQLEPPTVESAKEWLYTSVRPCVERLIGAVPVDELLQLLGLDGYAEAFQKNRNGEESA